MVSIIMAQIFTERNHTYKCIPTKLALFSMDICVFSLGARPSTPPPLLNHVAYALVQCVLYIPKNILISK